MHFRHVALSTLHQALQHHSAHRADHGFRPKPRQDASMDFARLDVCGCSPQGNRTSASCNRPAPPRSQNLRSAPQPSAAAGMDAGSRPLADLAPEINRHIVQHRLQPRRSRRRRLHSSFEPLVDLQRERAQQAGLVAKVMSSETPTYPRRSAYLGQRHTDPAPAGQHPKRRVHQPLFRFRTALHLRARPDRLGVPVPARAAADFAEGVALRLLRWMVAETFVHVAWRNCDASSAATHLDSSWAMLRNRPMMSIAPGVVLNSTPFRALCLTPCA